MCFEQTNGIYINNSTVVDVDTAVSTRDKWIVVLVITVVRQDRCGHRGVSHLHPQILVELVEFSL